MRAWVALAIVAFAARGARAASCCGTNPALGNRLAPGEAFATGVAQSLAESVVGLDARTSVSATFRAGERWQVGFVAPFVVSRRPWVNGSEQGMGLGDLSLNARFATTEPSTWAVLAQWLVPTGRALTEGALASGADATGKGRHEVRVTGWWEPELEGDGFVTLSLTAVGAGPDRAGFLKGEAGLEGALVGGWSRAGWAASAALRESAGWTFPTSGDGGHRRRLTASITAVVPLSASVAAVANAWYEPAWPLLASRDLLENGASVGLRWALER